MIRLSPSTLNLFCECPRCFWLHINKKIKRPSGPFPSLPGGMDINIKKYFDECRIKDELPPELIGKVEGKLMSDLKLMTKWRNWRTGLEYRNEEIGAYLSGALDECLQDEEFYIPFDYKTRGSAPHSNSSKYYVNQLSFYNLLLSANNYKIRGYAYLFYYYPIKVKENGVTEFATEPVKVNTDIEKARTIFFNAVELLKSELPFKNEGCDWCKWNNEKERK